MSRHDYAGCGRAACRLCDAFGDGWSQGKVKMRGEIVAAAAERRHAADCGCVPCAAVREVLRQRAGDFDSGRDALETEIVASTRHPACCGCRACALLRAVWTLTPAQGDDDDDDDDEMVTA